jgi:hypothetical protein
MRIQVEEERIMMAIEEELTREVDRYHKITTYKNQ